MCELYTVKEVAEILHTNPAYVYRLFKSGRLTPLKIGSLKVRKETLAKFLSDYEGFDITDPSKPVKLQGVEE